jgi:hypothetical protein
MKHLSTLVLLLSFINVPDAQVFPTASQTSVWTVDYSIFGGIPPNGSAGKETITTSAAIELCGELWIPIILADTNYHNNWYYEHHLGYYRVEGEQVYWRTEDCNEPEGVLYDFSLDEGDSIYCLSPLNYVDGEQTNMAWYHVAYVTDWAFGGTIRRVLFLNMHVDAAQSYLTTWVEGIGDIHHPFRTYSGYCPFNGFCEISHDMACLRVENEVVYSNEEEQSCAYSEESYLSIIEDGKAYLQLTTICDVSGGTLLKMDGDTLINGMDYTKAYAIVCDEEEPELLGFLRANETNSKLWFTNANDEEQLLIDLDLEIGDVFTFPYEFSLGEDSGTVTDIVEVNGRKEIVFDTRGGGCLIGPDEGPVRFIEGIGPTYDIAVSEQTPGTVTHLLHCVTIGDSTIYENIDTEDLAFYNCLDIDCMPGIFTGGSNVLESEPIFEMIYVLGQDKLLITSFQKGVHYFISNVAGNKVAFGEFNLQQNSVSTRGLEKGIYFIYCYAGGAVQTQKFIVF